MLPAVPRPGDVLGGRFRVARMIARGGMSVVLEGEHVRHGAKVAIKVLQVGGTTASRAAARMEREARLLSSLKSPHIARVYGVGITEQGTPYLVMELLEGGDLAALLDTEGPPPVEEAVAYIIQACRGIGEAHGRGVVHRDLKPANLFLSGDGRSAPCLKVLDFGVSKAAEAHAVPSAGSRDHIIGTPLYMAPEQFATPSEVNARADVWALGVCLFELLTGQVPFREKTILRQYARIITQPAPAVRELRPEVSATLEAVVARCLRKEPAERFADARYLAAALERAVPEAATLANGHAPRAALQRVSRLSTLRAVVATVTEVEDGLETRHFEPERDAPALRASRRPLYATAAAALFAITYGLWDSFDAGQRLAPIVVYATDRAFVEKANAAPSLMLTAPAAEAPSSAAAEAPTASAVTASAVAPSAAVTPGGGATPTATPTAASPAAAAPATASPVASRAVRTPAKSPPPKPKHHRPARGSRRGLPR